MYATALDYGSHTPATPALGGRVTEIIQHSGEVSLSPLLLPMLAQLSHQSRWLVLIGAPVEIDRTTLATAGASLDHIRILRPSDKHSTLELARRALCTNTCHTVVSWHSQLEEEEMKLLQQSAGLGDIQGIVVRRR